VTGLPLLLGLASIGVAIGLGVYLLAGRRLVPAGVVVTEGAAVPAKPSRFRLTRKPKAAKPGNARGGRKAEDLDELPSILRRMSALAGRLTPADYTKRVQHKLDLAGNPRAWSPERLMAFKGLGFVAGVVVGFLVGVKHGFMPTVLFTIGLGALGLFLPDILVKNIGEKRQMSLRKGLPDAMDMLTVCVEAGLGFDAALARVARNSEGAVAEECARLLQEMQFGKSRAEALRALADRTDVAELRSFVSAMVQSGELGISIADVLREQSKEMRIKRRQRAEEKAQKLQVKLLAPLVICLLPAMFIVILGPAILNIMHFFHQAN
jgi:tight adherence protein C